MRRNPSHKVYARRYAQHARELALEAEASERVFIGILGGEGITYADRKREVGGDYARLAFLSFRTLQLTVERSCPPALRRYIEADAERVQARKGEPYQISTAGQCVILGWGL